MIIKLTRAGRETLAVAVDTLIANAGQAPWEELIGELAAADRAALLAAPPRDVFITALRCWREAAPRNGRIVRNVVISGLIVAGAKIYPRIAAAQRQLRA